MDMDMQRLRQHLKESEDFHGENGMLPQLTKQKPTPR